MKGIWQKELGMDKYVSLYLQPQRYASLEKMHVQQHQCNLPSCGSPVPLSHLPSLPPSISSTWNCYICLLRFSQKPVVESEPTLHLTCFWLAMISFSYECMLCGKNSQTGFAQCPSLAEMTVAMEASGYNCTHKHRRRHFPNCFEVAHKEVVAL